MGQCGIVKGKTSPCTGRTDWHKLDLLHAQVFILRLQETIKNPKSLACILRQKLCSKSFTKSVSASQGSMGIQLLK